MDSPRGSEFHQAAVWLWNMSHSADLVPLASALLLLMSAFVPLWDAAVAQSLASSPRPIQKGDYRNTMIGKTTTNPTTCNSTARHPNLDSTDVYLSNVVESTTIVPPKITATTKTSPPTTATTKTSLPTTATTKTALPITAPTSISPFRKTTTITVSPSTTTSAISMSPLQNVTHTAAVKNTTETCTINTMSTSAGSTTTKASPIVDITADRAKNTRRIALRIRLQGDSLLKAETEILMQKVCSKIKMANPDASGVLLTWRWNNLSINCTTGLRVAY